MKKEFTLNILCCLFSLLFLYTGLNKLIDNDIFNTALLKSPMLHDLAPLLKIAVPIVEVLIAIALFLDRTRRASLYSFLVMMAIFTVYVGFMLYFRTSRPCTCGGIIKYMSWHQHFYFNMAFTLLASFSLWLDKKVRTQKFSTPNHLSLNV